MAKQDDPRSIHFDCDACFSPKGKACTEPTDNGRRSVKWFHYSRMRKAEDAWGAA